VIISRSSVMLKQYLENYLKKVSDTSYGLSAREVLKSLLLSKLSL
jgi:hypothetical protein